MGANADEEQGSCNRANAITTWLHILINGLSSLLLSASNYTMQTLAAPTRSEVDRAHARGSWMDIGVVSVRNLSKIKWYRTALWIVLAVSSVPIHLLYNSAVFKSIDSNQYVSVVANPKWLEGGNFSTVIPWVNSSSALNDNRPYNVTWGYNGINQTVDIQTFFRDNYLNTSRVQNMSTSECISTYGTNFVSGHNHVVGITNENGSSPNETVFFTYTTNTGMGSSNSYPWLCSKNYTSWNSFGFNCDASAVRKEEEWIINGKKIDYCLSQIMPQHCTVQFSVQILVAVICMNLMKSVSMFLTLYKHRETTLVTIGDAIASFLDSPDELTAGRCLMDRKDISSWKVEGAGEKPNTQPLPKTYFAKRGPRWFASASKIRWAICFLLIAITIAVSGGLLRMGAASLSSYDISPWTLGWSAIDSRAMIYSGLPQDGASGLVSSVLLANLPQAIVSFNYLLYNSLMTALFLAKEWSNYAFHRKALRVTTPHGSQRSTYYLQLPLRYSAPLLAISAVLHWVISQSIFLARIEVYDDGKKVNSSSASSVGYSCPPILTAIIIGIVLSIGAIAMGFRRLKGAMPVASSCSVAISAACHRPKNDIDAAYLPVQWGEIKNDMVDETGHCCFTTQPVTDLVPGRMYAGESEFEATSDRIRRRGIRLTNCTT